MLKQMILEDLKHMQLIEVIEKLYLFEESRHGDRYPYRTVIDNYIDKKYINSPEYVPDKDYLEYLDIEDPEIDIFPIIEDIEKSFDSALQKISVLDSDIIMECIFGAPLEKFESKDNSFPYTDSPSYNDDNRVRLQGGVILSTPSGKDGKLRPFFRLNMKEKGVKSGESNWVSSEDTLNRIRKGIIEYFSKSDAEIVNNFTYLGVKKDSKISKMIITTGSGGSDMYILDKENLRNISLLVDKNYSYKQLLEDKTMMILVDTWNTPKIRNDLANSVNKSPKKYKNTTREI